MATIHELRERQDKRLRGCVGLTLTGVGFVEGDRGVELSFKGGCGLSVTAQNGEVQIDVVAPPAYDAYVGWCKFARCHPVPRASFGTERGGAEEALRADVLYYLPGLEVVAFFVGTSIDDGAFCFFEVWDGEDLTGRYVGYDRSCVRPMGVTP